jgi:hypothetical protein
LPSPTCENVDSGDVRAVLRKPHVDRPAPVSVSVRG